MRELCRQHMDREHSPSVNSGWCHFLAAFIVTQATKAFTKILTRSQKIERKKKEQEKNGK